jgi:pimeloyl-ACP methyl ester carboxylesterase
VLRVDDRGVGGSTGDTSASTTEDLAGDVLAGVEFLKTRKEIDPRRIGLIGHSEGGLIAPLVASRSGDVAFIVLLAGTGVTGDEIIERQGELIAATMYKGEELAKITAGQAANRQIFKIVKEEADLAKAETEIQDRQGGDGSGESRN